MVPRPIRLLAGVLLAAGVAVLSSPARADDDDPAATKKAADAVNKLIGSLDDKDVTRQAQAVAKANDIERVMRSFKMRKDGGMGVGARGVAGLKDGIELAILDLAKKAPDAATLKANQADLVKMAQVTQAVAEINAHYPVPPPKPGKGAKASDYKKWNDDMRAGAKDLADAIKGGNPAQVEAAARKVTASCNSCHTGFRD